VAGRLKRQPGVDPAGELQVLKDIVVGHRQQHPATRVVRGEQTALHRAAAAGDVDAIVGARSDHDAAGVTAATATATAAAVQAGLAAGGTGARRCTWRRRTGAWSL